MPMELEEVKDFMGLALAAHAEESRESMRAHGEALAIGLSQIVSNKVVMDETLLTIQGMREESIKRTAILTTKVENIASTVSEISGDVKTLGRENSAQDTRIHLLEHPDESANKKSISIPKYTAPILATVLLLFVIGMFNMVGVRVVEDAATLIP